MQIFWPTAKRPEGVKNLTSGGLKAVQVSLTFSNEPQGQEVRQDG